MTILVLIGICRAGTSGTHASAVQLHSDGVYRPCGGDPAKAQNPFGLREAQWESAEANRAFLRRTWSRAVAMQNATAKPVRIILHQPGGWFPARSDGMRGAFPTLAVMNGRKKDGSELYPWRWAVWADELKAITVAHPDWILGVYFSGQVPTADAQGAVDARQAFETYDHDNQRHRRLMMDVVDRWMAIGVTEFLLDSMSQPELSAGVPALAKAINAKGGRLFVEAHPRDARGNLRLVALREVDGSLSLHRYMVANEPASLGWVVPAGVVMMVALTDHPIGRKPWRSTPGASDVQSYRKRGFVILSGKPAFDHFVSEPN